MDDLHPYDGRERRFRDTDTDPAALARARRLIAAELRLPAPPAGLRYDLSFYSGGDGVFDKLRASMPCSPGEAAVIAAGAGYLALDGPWSAADREALEWLVSDDDEPARPLDDRVAGFIAEHRGAFQPAPGPGMRVWFVPGSDVNGWSLLYAHAGELAFIALEQG